MSSTLAGRPGLSSSPFWISSAAGHEGRMIVLAGITIASIPTGYSFEEVATLVMLTDTPLPECFFTRLKAEIRIIIRIAAAPVPMRGHFSMSMSEGAVGVMCVSEGISFLTKIVLLMFIFSSSNFCSTICIL